MTRYLVCKYCNHVFDFFKTTSTCSAMSDNRLKFFNCPKCNKFTNTIECESYLKGKLDEPKLTRFDRIKNMDVDELSIYILNTIMKNNLSNEISESVCNESCIKYSDKKDCTPCIYDNNDIEIVKAWLNEKF